MPNKYRSNVENILQATIDGSDDYNKPLSNVEKLLVELKEVIESGGSSEKFAKSISLTINSSTYVVTAQLLDQDDTPLGDPQTIDLPLESMVVNGSYNDQTKKVILTLKNGETVEFSIADLVDGLASQSDLDALATRVRINENNISSCKAFTDNASIDSNRKLYISATEPTGDIPPNSTWIDGKTIKTYGRTDNYFDEKYTGISANPNNIVYQPINVGDGDFTMSTTCPNVPGVNALLFFIAGNVDTGASSSNNGVTDNRSRTVTSINGYVTVAYRGSSDISPVDYETIVNSGTTAESYAPYLQWQ